MIKEKWWNTFAKGIIMGLCDVIPGVSGGTIAFITGIYERLMTAIANVFILCKESITWLHKRKTKRLRQAFKKADLLFLSVLFGGIFLAIIIGSKGILYLMEYHFAYTISFFLGLIVASAVSITKHLKEKSLANTTTLFIGIAIGVSFLLYTPLIILPGLPYLFIAGFLAVSALFLPGISGSFILFILGVYEYVLALVHDVFRRPLEMLVFIVGVILGAYVISKIVNWLFTKNKIRTLYGLLGLLIGSLSIPIKRLLLVGIPNQLLALVFMLVGFLTVIIIERTTGK